MSNYKLKIEFPDETKNLMDIWEKIEPVLKQSKICNSNGEEKSYELINQFEFIIKCLSRESCLAIINWLRNLQAKAIFPEKLFIELSDGNNIETMTLDWSEMQQVRRNDWMCRQLAISRRLGMTYEELLQVGMTKEN